jgi:Domain of unknown function (DUF4287)/Domain of unknown function (DUF5655)
MALHPAEMDAAIIANLPAKTGHDLTHWIDVLSAQGPFEKTGQAIAWLKGEHAIGHITATLIARHALGQDRGDAQTLLAQFFSTEAQRQLYEHLCAALVSAVPTTVVTPCKTYVGFGNPVQYAVVKPGRHEGLVVGLAIHAPNLPELEPSKGLGGSDKVRWKLQVNTLDDVSLVIAHISRLLRV